MTSRRSSTADALESAWVRQLRCATLFVGRVAIVCSTLFWAHRVGAQAEAAGDAAFQQERVIRLEDAAIDQSGRPIVDGLPGILSRSEASQAERDALKPLEEERDRALSGAPAARGSATASRLPRSEGAPPPLDGGDPDPDRLRPESQPALPTL